MISWVKEALDGHARAGTLSTAHGAIPTPVFMPVGTAGTVKAMTSDSVRSTGARVVLGNTYHLMLRPGAERVATMGGLHRVMDWPGPILTDSGGFQVMSLAKLRKLDSDGVTFQSHLDGSQHRLTPERSIDIQHKLDATISMVLDECTPFPATMDQASASMKLSLNWAARSQQAFVQRDGYGLFGIVQGSVYPSLRRQSAECLTKLGFPGYAVGGLAVGEGQETMFSVLECRPARVARHVLLHLWACLTSGMPSSLLMTAPSIHGAVARGARDIREPIFITCFVAARCWDLCY
jgi:queuine tRNA-ribosyltransferase